MKITATKFGDIDVRISLEPESEAEKYQIKGIVKQLEKAKADWCSWDDMEGRSGICIKAKLKI